MSLPTTTLTPDYIEDTTIITNTNNFLSSSLISDEEDTITASPTIMDMWMSQLQKDHPEISFVIPSPHDNQHIDNMMNFKRLLEQVGNTAYDTIGSEDHHSSNILLDSMGHTITPDQISNSAVLNMADLKNSALTGLERFFAGTDMHSLINYLWIGVVTSLVILTVIFVLFSCYFYRKFREWKKCNKDIRSHLNNDMYPGTLLPCDASANPEAAYYQMESPPCYTIATGLPTYDEALHNHQQHFAFGMKFIYPTLAAVHHQASNLISSWEKYDMQQQQQPNNDKEEKITISKVSQAVTKCKSASATSSETNNTKSATSSTSFSQDTSACSLLLPPPPSYDVAADSSSVALLAEHQYVSCDNVIITMPQLDLSNTSAKTSSDLTDIITV